jgi:hypothetical protein
VNLRHSCLHPVRLLQLVWRCSALLRPEHSLAATPCLAPLDLADAEREREPRSIDADQTTWISE